MLRELHLVNPTVNPYKAFTTMSDDYRHAGELLYQHKLSWNPERFEQYLHRLADHARGIDLPPGKMPIITYWLIDQDEHLAGVSRLRPILNDELLHEGGNIGYDVPPSQRMKGYGTELLRQTLLKAQQLRLKKILVTCNKDNIGSKRSLKATVARRQVKEFRRRTGSRSCGFG